MKPLYIFDLDGTLALIGHRRHHVECARDEQNWTAFYAACVDDLPNMPVVKTLRALVQSGADIWIFSGRSDEVESQTIDWLMRHTVWSSRNDLVLEMRHEGDHTPDDVLKRGWLNGMLAEDRERLVAVFEDRDRMVKMWRDAGVACFQVAPGEF